MTAPLLQVQDVEKRYRMRRGLFQRAADLVAVDGVSVSVERGKSLGVVGKSGSGKSTLARMILGAGTARSRNNSP